jgi:sulfate permease, SulP family
MSGGQHKPYVEWIAQGIANVVAPMFGGLPATGAIARIATNIRAGALTTVTGIIHAIALLAVLSFAALMFIRKVAVTATVTEVARDYIRESHIHIPRNKNIHVSFWCNR